MGNVVYEADRDEIIYLWQSSFGDTPDEISLFLDSVKYSFLGLRENGTLVSQLFLLPRKLQSGKPVFYLYAACTVPECRGWGYMSELLGAAEEYSRRNGEEYIFLLPSDEGLYGFYERFGYQPLCRQKRLRIKTEDVLKISMTPEYNGIICDESLYAYADEMYSGCGYKTFSNANVGIIYEVGNGEFRVTEWHGEKFAGAVKVLAGMENCSEIIIDLPASASVGADCEIYEMNHGMVLLLNNLDSVDSCFFLNYVLD